MLVADIAQLIKGRLPDHQLLCRLWNDTVSDLHSPNPCTFSFSELSVDERDLFDKDLPPAVD